MKKISDEEGQSLVEFALLIPLLIALCFLPLDFFRCAVMKMNVETAACEAAGALTAENLDENTVNDMVRRTYGDTLPDVSASLTVSGEKTKEYTYRVYCSDSDGFEERRSNYSYRTVTIKLTAKGKPVSPAGRAYYGEEWTVESGEIKKDVFMEGFDPEK